MFTDVGYSITSKLFYSPSLFYLPSSKYLFLYIFSSILYFKAEIAFYFGGSNVFNVTIVGWHCVLVLIYVFFLVLASRLLYFIYGIFFSVKLLNTAFLGGGLLLGTLQGSTKKVLFFSSSISWEDSMY